MIENTKGYYMHLRESGKLENGIKQTARCLLITAPLTLNRTIEKEVETYVSKGEK